MGDQRGAIHRLIASKEQDTGRTEGSSRFAAKSRMHQRFRGVSLRVTVGLYVIERSHRNRLLALVAPRSELPGNDCRGWLVKQEPFVYKGCWFYQQTPLQRSTAKHKGCEYVASDHVRKKEAANSLDGIAVP